MKKYLQNSGVYIIVSNVRNVDAIQIILNEKIFKKL